MTIAQHIVRVTEAGGDLAAIEFDGREVTWAALRAGIAELDQRLNGAGIPTDAVVGLLACNRLEPLAGFTLILGAGRALLLVNAVRPTALTAQEIAELSLACLVGSEEDLAPGVIDAAQRAGTLVIALSLTDGELHLRSLNARGQGPFHKREPGVLIEIQTSGTTGAPKRVSVSERTVAASLRDGVRRAKGAVEQTELAPKSSPTLMFTPLMHTSGTFNTLMSLFEVRPIVLFEKFDAEKYRLALRKYRPKFSPLPPAAIKMIVDSNATAEDFSSVIAVRAGTAPLPVALQDAFEQKFGVPILTTYGATEFMGVVASWTLDDYKTFGHAKRGSVGRASKGVELRVVDPESGNQVNTEEAGLLEAKLDRIDSGKDWIRTTDLARIDQDGFLYILGRTDDAIIRGGFKVMAGKVVDVLRQYPGVYEAAVIGWPDERLGEVPVAVVEPYPDAVPLDKVKLKEFAKERLTPYEVPAQIYFVDRLPRTVSEKISRPEVKRLLEWLTCQSSTD